MSAPAIRVLEHVTRTAPLGVRFWDVATRRAVTQGLTVDARSHARPQRQRRLSPNPSGAHVLHDAPEIGPPSWGDGTDAYWNGLGPRTPFTLEVADGDGRYLPLRLEALLPHRGFFVPDCAESPPGPLGVLVAGETPAGFTPLFPAPARTPGGGQAVIRASLRRTADDRPAAWAMVVAEAQGHVAGLGCADGRGELAMMFPFPELERRPVPASPVGSPPGGPSGALPTLTATVTLRVFHRPDLADAAAPDFCMLVGQPEVAFRASLSPASDLDDVQLRLGEDLWLHTADTASLYVG